MTLCDGTVSALRFRSVAGMDLGLATKRAIDCLLSSGLESMPSSASRSMGLLFVSHLRKIWCARVQLAPPGAHRTTTVRHSRQGTGPLASGRPGGPVPPIGAAACGLGCVYTPQPPAPRCRQCGGLVRARRRVPPPHARSWPSSLAPAARTCARACCCHGPGSDRPRLAAPFPPCCLQHMPP